MVECVCVCEKHLHVPMCWFLNAMCCRRSVRVRACLSPLSLLSDVSPDLFHTSVLNLYLCTFVFVCTNRYRCTDAQKGWFHLTRHNRRMIRLNNNEFIHQKKKFSRFFIFFLFTNCTYVDDVVDEYYAALCTIFRFFFLCVKLFAVSEQILFRITTIPITLFMPFYYSL